MGSYNLKQLKLELNRNCPLHCIHCSSNGMPNAPEHLDARSLSALISGFIDLGGEKLCISGGEPLCYDELQSIIGYCSKASIDTSIYTTGIISNGGLPQCLSEKTAVFLTENGVRVIFSLHGAKAETHDMITRVPGSFNSTMTAIGRVVDAGASVEVHFVPMAVNFHEIADVAGLVSSLDISRISWLRFVPQGRGLFNKDILQLSKEQLKQLAQEKVKLQRMYPTLTIRTGSPFNILCPAVPVTCEAGLSILTIRPDGLIAPCDAFKQFQNRGDFGSILGHSLSEVWHKSSILNEVRMIHRSRPHSPCSSCPLYSKCKSGCLAQKSIAAEKLSNGEDPECLIKYVEVESEQVEEVSVF